MTNQQKQMIQALRAQGLSLGQIAREMDLPLGTVKSYCRRQAQQQNRCKNCRQLLVQTPGRRTKLFCSDHCRSTWWNHHRDCSARSTVNLWVCAHCDQNFTGYTQRKYCSHRCYIQHRFGSS